MEERLLNFGLPFFLKLTHLRCSSLARSPYYERQWLSTVLFYSTFGIGMMMGKVLLAEFEMTAAKLLASLYRTTQMELMHLENFNAAEFLHCLLLCHDLVGTVLLSRRD